jgi:hypothetical protein
MTAARQWTREGLDRVHPLPDGWEWTQHYVNGDLVWHALHHWDEDDEAAEATCFVWPDNSVDVEGDVPLSVALAVILASQGLDSREAMAAAMDSDEATARANAAALADASRGEPDLYVDAMRAVGCAEGFRHAAAMLRRGRVQP